MKRFLYLLLAFLPLLGVAQTNRLISSYTTKATPSGTDLFLMDTLTDYRKISYNQLSEALKTNPSFRGTITFSNGTLVIRNSSGAVVAGFGTNKWYGDGSLLSGLIFASTNAYSMYATNAGSADLATNVASGISITNATLSGTVNRSHVYLYSTGDGGTNYIVDFAQGRAFTIVATNNVNFLHGTNFTSATDETAVYVYAGAAERGLSYNAEWQMVQTNAPTTVASNKCAVVALGIKLPGTANIQTNVVCGVASSQ